MMAQLLQLLDWPRIRNKPAYASILHNLTATSAPTIGDDSGDGYAVGSRWINVSADKEYVCLDATVGAAVWTETTQSGGGTVDRSINMFRITTESGVPVSTSDRTAQTTIYACPAAGGATEEAQISLLGTDDATWETHDTAQMSIGLTTTRNGTTTNGAATITGLATTVDLVVGQEITGTGIGAGAVIASIDSATQVTASANSTADGTVAVTFKCPASKNYDLFVVNIAGTPTLVFGPVWTNDTTRATALTQKDGVTVLSGAFTVGGTIYAEGRLRHVGMVRTTTTAGQTEISFGRTAAAGGSAPKCYLWSRDNQERMTFWNLDSVTLYSRAADAAWRWYNWLNASTNAFNFILGDTQQVRAQFHALGSVDNNGGTWNAGIALDVGSLPSTIECDAKIIPGTNSRNDHSVLTVATAVFDDPVTAGKHDLTLLEMPNASVGYTTTTYGDIGLLATQYQSGCMFEVMA